MIALCQRYGKSGRKIHFRTDARVEELVQLICPGDTIHSMPDELPPSVWMETLNQQLATGQYKVVP